MNGRWIDRTVIPADKASTSLRGVMSDLAEGRLHEMMERCAAAAGQEPATLEGKVGACYTSFMDEARIAALGATPLAGQLAAVRAADTHEKVAVLMGRSNADFPDTLLALGIDVDAKDTKRYAVYVGQAGRGLPDRDYYLEAPFAAKKAGYEAYVPTLLRHLGWADAAARAADVVAYETAVAAASGSKVEQRNAEATYDAMSVAELERHAPGFAWKPFLAAAGLGSRSRLVVGEKSASPRLAEIFARTPVATLQAWLAFTLADNAAPYLSPEFAGAHFACRKQALLG